MITNLNHLFAKHYYSLGLNVGCICNVVSEYNFYEKNVLKSPCHEWKELRNRRQSEYEIELLPWEESTGVAIIGGYNNLHVFDIDGCSNFSFVKDILMLLGLPIDYEWVVKSGSNNGYHIYFFSEVLDGVLKEHTVSTYPPNFLNESLFEKFEILWQTPIVTSPSIHVSTNSYSFVNCRMPLSKPHSIEIERFRLVEKLFLNRKEAVLNVRYSDFSEMVPLIQPSDLEHVDLKKLKGSLFFIFDTETDGLINALEPSNIEYPNILQISWLIMDLDGIVHKKETRLISCDYNQNSEAFKINKLKQSVLTKLSESPEVVYKDVLNDLKYCEFIVAHNLDFDLSIVKNELEKCNLEFDFTEKKKICTMKLGMRIFNNNSKFPKLTELYESLFNYKIKQVHNAEADALIVSKCCRELIKRKELRYYV